MLGWLIPQCWPDIGEPHYAGLVNSPMLARYWRTHYAGLVVGT